MIGAQKYMTSPLSSPLHDSEKSSEETQNTENLSCEVTKTAWTLTENIVFMYDPIAQSKKLTLMPLISHFYQHLQALPFLHLYMTLLALWQETDERQFIKQSLKWTF